ncbi:flagellar hook-associated protein FlgK [Rhodobacteraceae bacterium SC52]|nr:flagellar hook-associated protein FlgK [Rhodobacteraceae bacterium SC52]
MSITGAMNTALSGLAAASRGAATVSNNLANAMTDGYARRELELTARSGTGGVLVSGEVRIMDQTVLTDRRSAVGAVSQGRVQVDFLSSIEDAIGEPGSPLSLSDLVTDVESSFVAAAAQPESGAILEQAVSRLGQLASRIGDVGAAIQTERGRADAAIGEAVSQLNSDFARLEDLNEDIRRAILRGENGGGLLDERQLLIDRISELVPVREVDKGNGTVALMSEGGILMDGPAPVIGFQGSNVVTEFQTLDGGTLSGLTVNGVPLDLDREMHLLSGGALEGQFDVRDTYGTMAQERLDGFARDILERFQVPGVDPTLAPGSPGLLTDAGATFDPADEIGLSRRLEVNSLVDPDQGGAAWRLRDGLGSASVGAVGDGAGLQRLADAFSALAPPVSGGFPSGVRTASGVAAAVLSSVAMVRDTLEGVTAHAAARAEALNTRLQANGVDSDAEMQRLLLIEQSYAANAKVISASQTMLDLLMEI